MKERWCCAYGLWDLKGSGNARVRVHAYMQSLRDSFGNGQKRARRRCCVVDHDDIV